MSKTEQTVDIAAVFGGGYELAINGQFFGIFPTARAAEDFAAAVLLADAKAEEREARDRAESRAAAEVAS